MSRLANKTFPTTVVETVLQASKAIQHEGHALVRHEQGVQANLSPDFPLSISIRQAEGR